MGTWIGERSTKREITSATGFGARTCQNTAGDVWPGKMMRSYSLSVSWTKVVAPEKKREVCRSCGKTTSPWPGSDGFMIQLCYMDSTVTHIFACRCHMFSVRNDSRSGKTFCLTWEGLLEHPSLSDIKRKQMQQKRRWAKDMEIISFEMFTENRYLTKLSASSWRWIIASPICRSFLDWITFCIGELETFIITAALPATLLQSRAAIFWHQSSLIVLRDLWLAIDDQSYWMTSASNYRITWLLIWSNGLTIVINFIWIASSTRPNWHQFISSFSLESCPVTLYILLCFGHDAKSLTISFKFNFKSIWGK